MASLGSGGGIPSPKPSEGIQPTPIPPPPTPLLSNKRSSLCPHTPPLSVSRWCHSIGSHGNIPFPYWAQLASCPDQAVGCVSAFLFMYCELNSYHQLKHTKNGFSFLCHCGRTQGWYGMVRREKSFCGLLCVCVCLSLYNYALAQVGKMTAS